MNVASALLSAFPMQHHRTLKTNSSLDNTLYTGTDPS